MRRVGGYKVLLIIGAHREDNDGQAAVGLSSTFVEKLGCLRDLGLGLNVVGVDHIAKDLRIGNGVCDLAMIEVWGECHETGFGQSRAESFDCVVQPPPGM